ncbi:MAG: molecular chaperone TorD family protein, partial [Anaerolineae bacterium]|nr:molecular chaperone TorD family protein [Anaerolineae bacterium]
ADLAQAFCKPETGLEAEFTRLFLGPGRPVAPLHESVYREGRVMGETSLAVRRHLTAEGLVPCSPMLPDHISIELALMAHLTAQEALAWDAGESDEACRRLQQQETFLREHLTVWLPQLSRRVLAGRPVAYYAEVAQRTNDFVSGDAETVQAWLGDHAGTTPFVPTDREWWAVTLGPGCTLCHTCVEMCQPGALRGVRDETEGVVGLSLDPATCDGCAACERWCPEGAIRVAQVRPVERPDKRELARSALLACPNCGRLHVPKAMIDTLMARMGSDQPALRQRLLLCYDCKASGFPLKGQDGAECIMSDLSKDVSQSSGRNT